MDCQCESLNQINECECEDFQLPPRKYHNIDHVNCICRKFFGTTHLKELKMSKMKCKKRIKVLAQPKHQRDKYYPNPIERGKPKVQVIRSYEEQTPVRIKLLAYPKVRKLISARNEYKDFVNKAWMKRFDKLINESLYTVYSRLANVHLPKESQPSRKWTKEDWDKHLKWLSDRAAPKKEFLPEEIEREKVDLETLLPTLEVLSQPRHIAAKYVPEKFIFYKNLPRNEKKVYVFPDRIVQLATPRRVSKDDFDPFSVKKFERVFVFTPAINNLAKHKEYPPPEEEKPDIFKVPKGALKAVASKRTIELAQPKPRNDEYENERPLVNPKALKAKISKRIIAISKPANRTISARHKACVS